MSPNIFFFFGYYARNGLLTLNRQFWERPEILRKINDLTEHVISTLITDIFIDVAVHSQNYLIDYDARWTALVPMLIFTLWLNKRISSMFFFSSCHSQRLFIVSSYFRALPNGARFPSLSTAKFRPYGYLTQFTSWGEISKSLFSCPSFMCNQYNLLALFSLALCLNNRSFVRRQKNDFRRIA